MKKLSTAVLTAAVLATTTYVNASDWYIAPTVGVVVSDSEDFDTGASFYLSAGRQIKGKWNLELSTAYSELDVGGNGKYSRHAFNVSGLYFPSGQEGNYAPFALASIGGADVEFANTSNFAPTVELGAGVLKSTKNEALSLRGEVRYRLDSHHGKAAYNDDIFYEWTALLGAQLALGGNDDPMPSEANDAPLVLPAITFPLDSAQLTRNARATLDEVAAVLSAHPSIAVDVVGHADDTGPSDYNYTLSITRADAVTQYLTDAGVPSEQLNQRGVGEGRPVASNSTDDGRMRNRRVEFHVN